MSLRFFGCVLWAAICLSGVTGMIGCGSSQATQSGTISIVDPSGQTSGQLKSLAVTRTARLSMTPTGDKSGAGVDWAVTCGGSPLNGSITGGACGTLAPAHTADTGATIYTAPPQIPYLTNVVISASVTSDPSASSSLTLPIVALPIAVSFVVSAPSVGAGETADFQATALNDTSNSGVTWSATCGSSDCGAFSPTVTTNAGTTYTAPGAVPTGGTVTVTATSVADSTKSASVPVTITGTGTAGGIAVAVTPTGTYLPISGPARTTHFTATVTNDPAAAGVNWSLTCGSAACGSITQQTASGAAATYLGPLAVPPGGTVTITATSISDASKTATAIATIETAPPIAVTITQPPPATLAIDAQASLIATVADDPGNAGVDWTASCGTMGACGTFSLSPAHTASGGTIQFTAPAAVPAGNVVTITATSSSSSPANPTSVMTTIVPPVASIAFVQEPAANVVAKARVPVSATVTNDAATGGGVTWTVQCAATDPGACGFVTPYQTADGASASYVAPPAPPSGTITVIATSTAFPDQTVSSTPVTITASTAISIGFVPFAPAQLTTAATVNLIAGVTNDATSAGVDWAVCASGCGFFTVKPAIAAIPATSTTPFVPAVPAVTATAVSAWPNGLAIPYTAPDSVPQSGDVAISAIAHVDGATAAAANIAILTASAGTVTGPSLTGVVQAGTMPVVGAAVSLYAAGTTGYGSASIALPAPGQPSSAITDANGGFTLAGGYICPSASSQVYLVAIGGKVGTNAANPNLSMMTALGTCSNLGSTPVVLNEVTTVASVWPLAPFSTNQPLTGLTGYLNIGSSSSNALGLANAFAAVNNLADITTGEPLYTVPAGNASVPYVEINTLADMLNSCTATAGGQYGDGSACGNLFSATAPLYLQPQFGSVPPSDTIQAAFNAAQHPSSGNFDYTIGIAGTGGLYSLVSPGSAFLPILPTTPSDLSISVHYTGGGGLMSTAGAKFFAIDASGDVWITATTANRVIELSNLGAGVSPSGGFTAGGINSPGPIAIDPANNVWVSNADSLTELNATGAPAQGTPFYGLTNGLNMAIDGLNNVWVTNPNGVSEFDSLGAELSPVGGYMNDGVSAISQIVVDPSNNIWIGNQPNQSFNLAELGDSNGQVVVSAQLSPAQQQTPMVADGTGKIWATPASQLCDIPPYGGIGTVLLATCYIGGPSTDALATIYNANGIALDGAGSLWIANAGGNGVLPNITEILPSQTNHYGGFFSPSLGAGTLQASVDASGNVWVLLADDSITEYVGVAVPAQTPIAAALKSKKLGKTP